AEPSRVSISGEFPFEEVPVLVHRVARQVSDIGTDEHGVTTRGKLRGEADVELRVVGTGDGVDGRDVDRAVGAAKGGNTFEGEGIRTHRLVKGHSYAAERPKELIARRAVDNLRPLDDELGDILVAGAFAGCAVVVLVHRAAVGVQDVGPQDHRVVAQAV